MKSVRRVRSVGLGGCLGHCLRQRPAFLLPSFPITGAEAPCGPAAPVFLSSGRFGMLPHLRGRRRCAGRRAAEDGKTGTGRDDCPRWRQSGRRQATEVQAISRVRQSYRWGKRPVSVHSFCALFPNSPVQGSDRPRSCGCVPVSAPLYGQGRAHGSSHDGRQRCPLGQSELLAQKKETGERRQGRFQTHEDAEGA